MPGLLHKYRGRVLLIVTGACPVHCRYCFRRHFPYGEHALSDEALERAIDYVRADASIHEVILSGGDPLSLDDEALAALRGEALRDPAPAPPADPHALADRDARRASTPRCSTGWGDRDCGR